MYITNKHRTHKSHTQTSPTNITHRHHKQFSHTQITRKPHTQSSHTKITHKHHKQSSHENTQANARSHVHTRGQAMAHVSFLICISPGCLLRGLSLYMYIILGG